MPTLQCLSVSALTVADVPDAIVAAKHTNAPAKATEIIVIFVNFVFIVIVSFCLSFCCSGLPLLLVVRSHFWPFTRIQNGNEDEVTQKIVGEFPYL
jgi:hypothetical protein